VARVLPLGPWLEIQVIHRFELETQDVYDMKIVPHGGEVIDRVAVEVLRGTARVSPPQETRELAPGTQFHARVNVAGDTPVPPAVRVLQEGRVDRSYDIELREEAE
jgi:hypothetical protein